MSGLDAAAIALRRKQTTDARAQLQRLEALLARARSGALKLPDGGAKLERNICDLKREVELQERESTAAEAVQSTTLAVPSISTPSGPIKSTTAIQSTTSLAVPPRATSADEMNVLTAAIGQLSISHGQGVNNGDPPTLSVAQLRQRVASQSGRITTREETKFAERGISCRHGKLGPLGGALSVDAVRRTRARLEAEEAALREGGGGRQLHLLSCARPLESEEVLRDEMGDEVGDEVRDEMRTASSVPSNPQQSPSPARGAGGYFDAGASSAGARASSGARAAIQGELPAPCDMEGVQGPGGVAREASDSGALESSSAASLSSAASSWSAAANASSPAGRDAAGGAGTGTDGSNGAPRKGGRLPLPPGMENRKDPYGNRETLLLPLEQARASIRRSYAYGMDIEECPEAQVLTGLKSWQTTGRPPLPSSQPPKKHEQGKAEVSDLWDGTAGHAYQDTHCFRISNGDGDDDSAHDRDSNSDAGVDDGIDDED